MSIGADWYPRDPRKFIRGVQGMTAKQHAVYSIVIDLMYANGGDCPNDPKFVAGHFADIGPSTARKAIEYLLNEGRIITLDNGRLSNKTVQKLAKTREKTREKRRISGEKGGKKSAELCVKPNESNALDQPSGPTAVQPDKSRVDKSIKTIQKDFDLFWAAYPKSTRKSGKADAKIQFTKIITGDHSKQEKTTAEEIIKGVNIYSKHVDPQFVKAPTAWLNAGMWEVDAPSRGEMRMNGMQTLDPITGHPVKVLR